MSNQHLRITFRFVQPFPLFHGRADGDAPEWPPSPMRAYQAILNGASMRARGRLLAPEIRQALDAISSLRPQIIAPRVTVSSVGFRAYVPHNQADLVTAAWYRGNLDTSIAAHRVEKDFRPMRIESVGEDLPAIHYLYALEATDLDPNEILRTIRPSVRAVTHLGWGIDQVVGDASLVDLASEEFSGERWLPSAQAGRRLRVHRNGSLDALTKRHRQFLDRLEGGWTPVSPLREDAVDHVRYRRDTDPLPRPHAIFKLVDDNDDAFRYPHAKLMHIAGMVRHLAIKAMDAEKGSPPPWIENPAEWVNRVVRGKRDETAGDNHKQFSYVPLPSIGHAHSDALIRNVMIVAPLGMQRELDYVAERLDGLPLHPEGDPDKCHTDTSPLLSGRVELQMFTPPPKKFIAECYLGTSSVWETVTPVILDGCTRKRRSDKPDAIARLTERLIYKALARAGIEAPCEFMWQSLPFFKNTLSAHKHDARGNRPVYFRPNYLNGFNAVHLRIRFGHNAEHGNPASPWIPFDVPGPLLIGAGRHCGLGVFAALTVAETR